MGGMGTDDSRSASERGLNAALARAGMGEASGLARLTGGATMESWRFASNGEAYVLRRAPSLEFMEGRPYGHDSEAAIIAAAFEAGVTAPEVVLVLQSEDGIGSGGVHDGDGEFLWQFGVAVASDGSVYVAN